MEYIVFFTKGGYWWLKPLGEFGHTFIAIKTHDGQWVGFDACGDGFTFRVINDKFLVYLMVKYKHVHIVKHDAKVWHLYFPMIKHCTSFTKAILGIRNPLIITPKQLYNYLRKIEQYNEREVKTSN